MSTVTERLLESWLDSQGERRYQPAFIQLLISEGWRVLHNTRHSPIEFGKDVIARSPTGELHAFQLKGNPGSRLTKSQAQEIAPQIVELVDAAVPDAYRVGTEKHIAVLVTNGEVDEEAELLFDRLVKPRTTSTLAPSNRFEIWSRGSLLAKFSAKAAAIWPSSLEGIQKLLTVYSSSGAELPNPKKIAEVLHASVGQPSSRMSSNERRSRLTSALVLTEVIKGSWYRTDNHYALLLITIISLSFSMRFADNAARRKILKSYSDQALSHCIDLIEEARGASFDGKHAWAASDFLGELDIMRQRGVLIADCAAILVLSEAKLSRDQTHFCKQLISHSFGAGMLWGQGAAPAAIVRYWALRRLDATPQPDMHLVALLGGLLAAASGKIPGMSGLPDPYHDFEACWSRLNDRSAVTDSSLLEDRFIGRTWFATPLLMMLAKRNWKQTCKALWVRYSKPIHEDVDLVPRDFFDPLLSRNGSSNSSIFFAHEWSALVREAVGKGECRFLDEYEEFGWVIAAYVAIVPYRAWTTVLMWLDARLSKTWYSVEHLPVIDKSE